MVRVFVVAVGMLALLAACAEPPTRNPSQQERSAKDAASQADWQARVSAGRLPVGWRERVDRMLADRLNDPGSRRILEMRNPSGGLVCGRVNARNGFGGYGQPMFYYVLFGPDAQPTQSYLAGSGGGSAVDSIRAIHVCFR